MLLGWWEVAIGVSPRVRPLVCVPLALLLVRIPRILLAFILLSESTLEAFPLAPTPAEQYLVKDRAILSTVLAIESPVCEEGPAAVRD